MMRTALWPSSWNARMRWSGTPRPTWMSGEVTSIPSFTRSGRPSFSFRSSAPSGSTSTAFRVRCSNSPAIGPTILEVVRQQALRAEHVLDAEGEAREPEHRRDSVERAADGSAHQREAEARREQRHRDRSEEGEEPERRDCQRMTRDGREKQDADTRASPHAVHDSDACVLPRGSRARAVVRVVIVLVDVEKAAPPA